jgi:hypothetical protein
MNLSYSFLQASLQILLKDVTSIESKSLEVKYQENPRSSAILWMASSNGSTWANRRRMRTWKEMMNTMPKKIETMREHRASIGTRYAVEMAAF